MRKAILITLAFAVIIWACVVFAAPMPPNGPVTIEGTIKEIRWHPHRRLRATSGMSGYAGEGPRISGSLHYQAGGCGHAGTKPGQWGDLAENPSRYRNAEPSDE